MSDTKICKECNEEFTITEGFKKLMEENPDIVAPKRCYPCRKERKNNPRQ